jgi:hypothetical protein
LPRRSGPPHQGPNDLGWLASALAVLFGAFPAVRLAGRLERLAGRLERHQGTLSLRPEITLALR